MKHREYASVDRFSLSSFRLILGQIEHHASLIKAAASKWIMVASLFRSLVAALLWSFFCVRYSSSTSSASLFIYHNQSNNWACFITLHYRFPHPYLTAGIRSTCVCSSIGSNVTCWVAATLYRLQSCRWMFIVTPFSSTLPVLFYGRRFTARSSISHKINTPTTTTTTTAAAATAANKRKHR